MGRGHGQEKAPKRPFLEPVPFPFLGLKFRTFGLLTSVKINDNIYIERMDDATDRELASHLLPPEKGGE